MKKVLKRFNMSYAKPMNVPLGGHFKLSKTQSLTTEDEKVLILKVPYELAVGRLMYSIVCTRPGSRYMSNLGKEH